MRLSRKKSDAKSGSCPIGPATRRVGAIVFCFFLIKGLLWLLVPATLAAGAWMGWWADRPATVSTP